MPQRLLYCHHIVICHLQFGWKERLWKHPMFKITLNVQIEETLPSRHCWVLAAVNSFCFFNSLFSVVNCPPLLVIPGHFTSWATCCCYTEMYAFFCKKGKSSDCESWHGKGEAIPATQACSWEECLQENTVLEKSSYETEDLKVGPLESLCVS